MIVGSLLRHVLATYGVGPEGTPDMHGDWEVQ